MVESGTILIGMLIFVGVVFLGILIFLGIYLYRRRKENTVLCKVLSKDGKWISKRVKNPSTKVKLFGGTYIYDEKAETRNFWGKEVHWWFKDPNPIIYDAPNRQLKLSSESLNNVVEDNFIGKLFQPVDLLSSDHILLYIIVGMVALLVYKLLFDPVAVVLANDSETINLITKACRAAITKG